MIYKSYIFKTSLLNWLSITLILVVLIWFSRAITFLNLVIENGIKISDFFFLFVLILPWILIYILPISFFVSTLLSLNKLNNNSEIVILKNCGLSNLKISKPIIFLGIFITLICYFLSFYLMPLANKQLRISRNTIKENYTNIAFNPQTFESFNGITLYSAKRDDQNNLEGLIINDQTKSDSTITITAQKGNLVVQDDAVYLKLWNGSLQKYIFESGKTEILKFDSYVFNLNNKDQEYSDFKWKPNERFITELINYDILSTDEQIRALRSELHKRINEPLISLIFSLIISTIILNSKLSRRSNFGVSFWALCLCLLYVITLIFSFRITDKIDNIFFIPYFVNIIFLATFLGLINANFYIKK